MGGSSKIKKLKGTQAIYGNLAPPHLPNYYLWAWVWLSGRGFVRRVGSPMFYSRHYKRKILTCFHQNISKRIWKDIQVFCLFVYVCRAREMASLLKAGTQEQQNLYVCTPTSVEVRGRPQSPSLGTIYHFSLLLNQDKVSLCSPG